MLAACPRTPQSDSYPTQRRRAASTTATPTPRRRAPAPAQAVLLREALPLPAAPLGPRDLVEPLRERLHQSVGERLDEDRSVVVVAGLVLAHEVRDAVADPRGEQAEVVGDAVPAGR